MYAMLVGQPPFEAGSVRDTLSKIRNAEIRIPAFISPCAADLITKMLMPNPNQRITIDDVLNHPFL
jgi:serine/threonine protein kinase